MLKLADTSLILINPSQSNVNTLGYFSKIAEIFSIAKNGLPRQLETHIAFSMFPKYTWYKSLVALYVYCAYVPMFSYEAQLRSYIKLPFLASVH